MPFVVLVMLVQVACVVHAIRTGRDRIWITVIVLLPAIGCLAYLIAELLPDIWRSQPAHDLKRAARDLADPEADLRRLADDLAAADTVENRRRYATECLRLGQAAKAVAALEPALAGIHADDIGLHLDLAQAHFASGGHQRALALLDRVKEVEPGYESASAHLLYARALEALGRDDEARREYESLVGYFPGEEARCRYALLLERTGSADRARALFAEILQRQKRAPRHAREAEREWADVARSRIG